jgi:hypothetical protein
MEKICPIKKIYLSGIVVICFITNAYPTDKLTDIVLFASVEKSKSLLTQEDDFTHRWSPMDIDIRMQKANSTKEELMNYIPAQIREWNETEKNLLRSILDGFDQEIAKQGYHIHFPDTIYFIKSTLDEEAKGSTAYTRSNYVVFNGDKIIKPDSLTKLVVIHEIFHVLSRHDPELRAKMYNIIGFKLVNEIQLSEDLAYFKLTNPDAPFNNNYINLTHEGEPVECVMIAYADRKYTGGSLWDYANIGLLKLTGTDIKQIDMVNGEPVIYKIEEVTGFFEQIGRNTDYIIHPEEIMADNFAFTLIGAKGLLNPETIDKIKRLLKE